MITTVPMDKIIPLVPWMKLEIGGVPALDHIKQLRDAGFVVGHYGESMMRYREGYKRTVTLARCRVRDLGFTEQPIMSKLLARVAQVGEICPPEVGLHLREKFTEQPSGLDFRVWVAMTPIRIPSDCFYADGVFHLGRSTSGMGWLDGSPSSSSECCYLNSEIVLVLK